MPISRKERNRPPLRSRAFIQKEDAERWSKKEQITICNQKKGTSPDYKCKDTGNKNKR